MGKREVCVLPPLVYGKPTGTLDFVVDQLHVTDKTHVKRKDINLAVQILWWGETKPCFVRPKKVQIIAEGNERTILNEAGENCVKYEIKTKPKLFRSYLEKCDVLELVIFEGVRSEVVGSAFLRDLIHIVFKPQLLSSSIINDSGDEIGEIIYHFVYCEIKTTFGGHDVQPGKEAVCLFDAWHKSDFKLNLSELETPREHVPRQFEESKSIGKGSPPSQSRQYIRLPENGKKLSFRDECEPTRSMTRHYNTPVASKHDSRGSSPKGTKISGKSEVRKETPKTRSSKTSPSSRSEGRLSEERKEMKRGVSTKAVEVPDRMPNADEKRRTAQLAKLRKTSPKSKEVAKSKANDAKTAKTAPKPVKAPPSARTKPTIEKRFPKSGTTAATDRTGRNVKKAANACNATNRSNPARGQEGEKGDMLKSILKPGGAINTFRKVSDEISKVNKYYLGPCQTAEESHPDLEEVPVRESRQGCGDADNVEVSFELREIDKEPEGVEPLGNDKGDFLEASSPEPEPEPESRVNVKNNLCFDLNDPIERVYYETFFLKTEAPVEEQFEIAEMLNKFEDKSGGRDCVERVRLPFPQEKTRKEDSLTFRSVPKTGDCIEEESDGLSRISEEKESYDSKGEEFQECKSTHPEGFAGSGENSCGRVAEAPAPQRDCYRCKYYKKLSELDMIIDALKRFESNMRKEAEDESFDADDCRDDVASPEEPEAKAPETDLPGESGNPGMFASVEVSANESDFSKEDSDFNEFIQYMSQHR